MKLLEQDWNHPGGVRDVEYDYPDKPIADFMNWLRRSQRWRESPQVVEEKLRALNLTLLDIRQAGPKPKVETGPMSVADRMAKARAARKGGVHATVTA